MLCHSRVRWWWASASPPCTATYMDCDTHTQRTPRRCRLRPRPPPPPAAPLPPIGRDRPQHPQSPADPPPPLPNLPRREKGRGSRTHVIDAVKTGRCQGAGSSQEVLHGRGAAHACRRGDVCPAAHPSRPGRLRQKLAPCWPQALTTPSKRQPVNLCVGWANERDRGAGGSFGGSAAEFRGSATPGGTRRAAARRVHSGLVLTGRNPDRLSGHWSGRRMFQNLVPPGPLLSFDFLAPCRRASKALND